MPLTNLRVSTRCASHSIIGSCTCLSFHFPSLLLGRFPFPSWLCLQQLLWRLNNSSQRQHAQRFLSSYSFTCIFFTFMSIFSILFPNTTSGTFSLAPPASLYPFSLASTHCQLLHTETKTVTARAGNYLYASFLSLAHLPMFYACFCYFDATCVLGLLETP